MKVKIEKVHTRDGLFPRSIEHRPEDFRASDRNLHDNLWRRLHQAYRQPQPQRKSMIETHHAQYSPAGDDGDREL